MAEETHGARVSLSRSHGCSATSRRSAVSPGGDLLGEFGTWPLPGRFSVRFAREKLIDAAQEPRCICELPGARLEGQLRFFIQQGERRVPKWLQSTVAPLPVIRESGACPWGRFLGEPGHAIPPGLSTNPLSTVCYYVINGYFRTPDLMQI